MTTVRSRRLGRELRKLRDGAGLSREEAIAHLVWSRSKIERVEGGINVPKAADLKNALDLYGATPQNRAFLEELRVDAKRRGWWVAFGDVFDGTYVGLEDDASLIRSWQAQLVPGLLQTDDYARAVIEAARPDAPEAIDRKVRARAARRPLLKRVAPAAPALHVIIDESALRRTIGGPEVMRAQIVELLTAAQWPNVTIQVLPYSAGAHAGIQGPFVLLSFDEPDDPVVIYVESPAGDLYPESAKAVTEFNDAWGRLSKAALTSVESTRFLVDLTKE